MVCRGLFGKIRGHFTVRPRVDTSVYVHFKVIYKYFHRNKIKQTFYNLAQPKQMFSIVWYVFSVKRNFMENYRKVLYKLIDVLLESDCIYTFNK